MQKPTKYEIALRYIWVANRRERIFEMDKEEYYEKLRAILRVLDVCDIDRCERDTLIWIANEYLEKLGEAIGIIQRK